MKRSIFYVEGKESQKDILRLRQLEQVIHAENAQSTDQTPMITNEEAQSSSLFNESVNSLANGYPIEAAVQNELFKNRID